MQYMVQQLANLKSLGMIYCIFENVCMELIFAEFVISKSLKLQSTQIQYSQMYKINMGCIIMIYWRNFRSLSKIFATIFK